MDKQEPETETQLNVEAGQQENAHKQQKGTRPPWRTLLGLILLIAAVTVLSTTLWNLKFNKYRLHETIYGIKVVDPSTAQQSVQRHETAVAKAKQLRAQWRPWALQHKQLLTQMLHAQSSDVAVLERVYEALPMRPYSAGITLTGASSVRPSPTEMVFTWQPLAKAMRSPRHGVAQEADRSQDNAAIDAALRRNFSEYRDIGISESMSPGKSNVTVWASGRITETSLVRQAIKGKPAFVRGTPQEIDPPYDFVRD